MICTLEELNNVVNDVVNRIVKHSTERTMSSNYYASYDNVSDLISKEDFLKYFDLIAAELQGREEVLELQTTEDHEFDAIYGTNWCPMYEDHEDGFITEPVSQPLSMTRKAEILDRAVQNLQAQLDRDPSARMKDVLELLGVSVTELAKLGMPAAKEAVFDAEATKANALANHDPSRPIEFEVVENQDLKTRSLHASFEEALDAFEAIPAGVPKEFFCHTYQRGVADESVQLMRADEHGDVWHNSIDNETHFMIRPPMNLHIRLALAKTTLHKDPENKEAWGELNGCEKLLGVTGHVLGEHDFRAGNWRVHIVPPNGTYGRNDCCVNDSGKHIVEFYDLRYRDSVFAPNGQFTGASYYASTLLGEDGWSRGDYPNGLSLVADIPAWTVTGPQMKVILDFIRENTKPKERPSLEAQIRHADSRNSDGNHSQPESKDNRGR